MGATRRGQLCLALLCVLHVQSGSAAVPRTAASQPRLADTGLFEQIKQQVQVMTGLLDELDQAVADVTTVPPPPPTTTALPPEPTQPSPTATTESTDTSSTATTESTDTSSTATTESTDTSSTATTESTDTSSTATTESTDTSSTATTESTETSSTATTESTDTSSTATTESTDTSSTATTESTDTSSTATTESTETSSTATTESTDTSSTATTESTDTSSTATTESTDTSSTATTESTDTSSTATTMVNDSAPVESNPGGREPVSHLIESVNSLMPNVEPSEACEKAHKDLTKTLDDASDALEMVANEEFDNKTLHALVDSNTKINTTVDCTKSNQIQLTDVDKSKTRSSIKDTQATAKEAEDAIDNIINPTPEPLPGLAISSPFMIVLITFSCLLAVVALVGVAMTVNRSLQGPPAAGRRRRPATGRVNAGYRPADTDTTELVERAGGRRRAATTAPVAPTAPAASIDPDRYDRLYEGAIPRAQAGSPPGVGRPWDSELPARQSAAPARRDFYNAY